MTLIGCSPPEHRPLLQVEDLCVDYRRSNGSSVRVVNDVSFDIEAGEAMALVGESGSGKTTVVRTLLKLMSPESGRITFAGADWIGRTGRSLRRARRDMQAVFQDPSSSLDPRMTVTENVLEPLVIHRIAESRKAARSAAQEMLDGVGIGPALHDRYPFELSGGQQQRIAIARALITRPKLVVCDEPLSALDVSVQAQIVNLFKELQETFDVSFLFVGHDLSVIRHLCDRVAVMYAGRLVETAPVAELFADPRHPYTQLLLSVMPVLPDDTGRPEHLGEPVLTGEVPGMSSLPSGCSFHPRCAFATSECAEQLPLAEEHAGGRVVACHRADEIAAGLVGHSLSAPQPAGMASPES